MNENKHILKVIKTKKNTLLILFMFEVLTIIISSIIFNKFIQEMEDFPIYFKYLFLIFCIIGFLIADIWLLENINKLKKLINITPIKCIIEDFIMIGYPNDGERKYEIYPVVKNLTDNNLYFTYSNYCLSRYNTIYSKMNNLLTSISIIRNDKSKVEIGDIAYLYIRKNIHMNINIDNAKNIVYLNKRKIYYNHINNKYDINIFNNLNYFEGIIDIENDIK